MFASARCREADHLAPVFKSKHFRATFAVLFSVAAAVFALACAALCSQWYAARQVELQAEVNKLSVKVQEVFSAAENGAVLIGSQRSVDSLLMLDQPAMDDYRSMIADLSPIANISYYESIDLFFERTRTVYVSQVGLYGYDEYPGQDLIRSIEADHPEGRWIVGRSYQMYYGDKYPMPVASYIRRLPVYSSQRAGYVALHLSLPALSKRIAEYSRALPFRVAAAYGDTLIYDSAPAAAQTYDPRRSFDENVALLAAADGNFYLCSTSGADVRCALLVERRALLAGLGAYLPWAACAFLLMSAGVTVCAYLYSARMLRPVRALMTRLGQAPGPDKSSDEYKLLDSAFERLSNEVANVHREMERSAPIIEERLILELVCSFSDVAARRDELARYGITFPHRRFAVVVLAFPSVNAMHDYTMKEQLKLVARRSALELLGALGSVYSAYAENESVLFLINSGAGTHLMRRVREICEAVAQNLREAFSFPLRFSLGVCPEGDCVPYRAYIQARSNLLYNRDAEGDEVFFTGARDAPTLAIDSKTVWALASCVLERDHEALSAAFERLYADYLPPELEARAARRLTCACLCLVYARLTECDADVDEGELSAAIRRLYDARDARECGSTVFTFLSQLAGREKRLPEESYAYVRKAMDYIHAHYAQALSIPQIADSVSLNPVYLGKLFKLSTDKTPSEYLNSYRVELSKKLLLESGETVAAISARIGYHDARSYIRFFRKYVGVTPNEFRQAAQQKKRESAKADPLLSETKSS